MREPSADLLDRLARLLAAAVAFAIPTFLSDRFILFHFYVRGSFLYDTGLLAALTWHSTPALPLPPSLGGQSFFNFHVAPVLSAGHRAQLAAAGDDAADVCRICGRLRMGCWRCRCSGCWPRVSSHRRGWKLGLAAVASTAFAFNGLSIAIARYPHFETLGAACLLLALAALVLRHRIVAALAFAVALATREDVGLHAFGFLFVWIALNRRAARPWRDDFLLLGFAAGGRGVFGARAVPATPRLTRTARRSSASTSATRPTRI